MPFLAASSCIPSLLPGWCRGQVLSRPAASGMDTGNQILRTGRGDRPPAVRRAPPKVVMVSIRRQRGNLVELMSVGSDTGHLGPRRLIGTRIIYVTNWHGAAGHPIDNERYSRDFHANGRFLFFNLTRKVRYSPPGTKV